LIKIIVASNNNHKIDEIKKILENDNYKVFSLKDLHINSDPEETGKTFEENALIKVRALKKYSDYILVGDDSGLLVEKLNNEPGVFSKRYAGNNGTDKKNNQLLIKNIKKLKTNERKAKFVTVMAIIIEGKEFIVKGECKGIIIEKPIGENGFGYDPIFYIDKYKKTFAQLTTKQKNEISHRGKAVLKFKQLLNRELK